MTEITVFRATTELETIIPTVSVGKVVIIVKNVNLVRVVIEVTLDTVVILYIINIINCTDNSGGS